MTKISNPVRFSDHFGFDDALLASAGVLNPTLNADTCLFIDPLLIEGSGHREIREGARAAYEMHFTIVIKLLQASETPGDVAWPP